MRRHQVLIFDFDGVIADTFKLVVEIGNQVIEEIGIKRPSDLETEKLRTMNNRDIFKTLGIPTVKIPLVAIKIKEGLKSKMHLAPLIPGVKEALNELHKKGFRMGILSSNSKESIRKFIVSNELDVFDFISSGVGIFGKAGALKRLVKSENFDQKGVIYIGDETRDIEAAKKCGLKVIAVSWGYHKAVVLGKENPDYLISRPTQLLKIIS